MVIIKNYILLLLVLLTTYGYANEEPVSVKLFKTKDVTTFIFSPSEGSYSIYGDGKLVITCNASDIFQFAIVDTLIFLKTLEVDIGEYDTVRIVANEERSAFKIKSVIPLSKVRAYDGDVEITLLKDISNCTATYKLINRVDIESYVAGVVESESGRWNNGEYYKLQAILCRTYLLTNKSRHDDEGYDVCDHVHCQVYLNKTTMEEIREAVFSTKALVVVDGDLNLITAAFHSNCGGETCNSEDVWASSTSYLKAIKDPYCKKKPHAHWQRTIPLSTWQTYLRNKKQSCLKPVSLNATTNVNYQRPIYYSDKNVRIPMKQIRKDFRLRSTYFTITQIESGVLFKGKGYGHGVGLCQEGAMAMSKMNFSYLDILNHYYKGVSVINLRALNYFRLE